ncbi:MAG TPA: MBL fold metallo-hydrolase [Thermodesulfobacteriota bacterium]|nr:MBL fold metallo-hydrolase [Thermodesulfobacteriota bacterium]
MTTKLKLTHTSIGNIMKIRTLASGSSGNSLFVETRRTKILVDAGLSHRQLTDRLKKMGVLMSDIDAVLITHEHTDHVAAIPQIKAPVYVSSSTVSLWKDKVKDLKEFEPGSQFFLNDALITPFPVPHDALDPVGFTIETDHKKLGIVTDIGSVTALVRERLRGSNALIIEFNYDEGMLLYGSYPWDLKQRIKSRLGHLSNEDAAELLQSLIHEELRYVILAHLSEVNNTPKKALESAHSAIIKNGSENIRLSVAQRNDLGEVAIV